MELKDTFWRYADRHYFLDESGGEETPFDARKVRKKYPRLIFARASEGSEKFLLVKHPHKKYEFISRFDKFNTLTGSLFTCDGTEYFMRPVKKEVGEIKIEGMEIVGVENG